MRTARSPQPQSVQLNDPLEVCEQHLHFLPIFTRLLVKTGPGHGTSDVACWLMNAALDPSHRRVRTAASLYRTLRTIGLAGCVVDRVGFGNVCARTLEGSPLTAQRAALRAAVLVALLVPLKVAAGQGVVCALSLIPLRHMRFDRFIVDHPGE